MNGTGESMQQSRQTASDQCNDGARLGSVDTPYGAAAATICEGGSPNKARMIGYSFGRTLERLREGGRAKRIGWNGPGQFVYLVPGSDPSHPDERAGLLSGISSRLFSFGDRGTARRLPHLALHNTRGESVPWAPSQTDMLADDWIPA